MEHERQKFAASILTVTFPGFGASRSQLAKYTGADGVIVLDPNNNHNYNNKFSNGNNAVESLPPRAALWFSWYVKHMSSSSSSLLLQEEATTEHHQDHGDHGEDGSKYDNISTTSSVHNNNNKIGNVLYHARCTVSSLILFNVLPSPEVDELHTGVWSWNPLHWLMYLKSMIVPKIFHLEGVPISYMELKRVNLAGFIDQAAFTAEVEKGVRAVIAEGKGRKLVLFGCSRGGATVCLSSLKLREELAKHVGLVILEAPFDTLDNVVRDSSWFPRLNMFLIETLGTYDGAKAYEIPSTTHLTCPIAFITSKADKRVPQSCTQRLMRDIASKHPQLTLEHLELNHSAHASMAIGDDMDRMAYIDFVRNLYLKNGLHTP